MVGKSDKNCTGIPNRPLLSTGIQDFQGNEMQINVTPNLKEVYYAGRHFL
jgi:hypothetical protein